MLYKYNCACRTDLVNTLRSKKRLTNKCWVQELSSRPASQHSLWINKRNRAYFPHLLLQKAINYRTALHATANKFKTRELATFQGIIIFCFQIRAIDIIGQLNTVVTIAIHTPFSAMSAELHAKRLKVIRSPVNSTCEREHFELHSKQHCRGKCPVCVEWPIHNEEFWSISWMKE